MKKFLAILLAATLLTNCSPVSTQKPEKTYTDKDFPVYVGHEEPFVAELANFLLFPITIPATVITGEDTGMKLTHSECAGYLCADVTICSTDGECHEVKHMLVDTGSSGIRVFDDALPKNFRKKLEDEAYVYKGHRLRSCEIFGGGGGLTAEGFVTPVIVKNHNFEAKTAIQIVTTGGPDTECASTFGPDSGYLDKIEFEGVYGIIGVKPVQPASGEDMFVVLNPKDKKKNWIIEDAYVDKRKLMTNIFGSSFRLKTDKETLTGNVKITDGENCNTKGATEKLYIVDTGDREKHGSEAEQIRRAEELRNSGEDPYAAAYNGYIQGLGTPGGSRGSSAGLLAFPSDPTPELDEIRTNAVGMGDMLGKTVQFCTEKTQVVHKKGYDWHFEGGIVVAGKIKVKKAVVTRTYAIIDGKPYLISKSE